MSASKLEMWSDLLELNLKLKTAVQRKQIVHIYVFDEGDDSSRMLGETYANNEVQKACSSFLNLKLHYQSPEYAMLSKFYSVDVLPSSIFVDSLSNDSSSSSENHVLLTIGGFVRPLEFTALISGVVSSHNEAVSRKPLTQLNCGNAEVAENKPEEDKRPIDLTATAKRDAGHLESTSASHTDETSTSKSAINSPALPDTDGQTSMTVRNRAQVCSSARNEQPTSRSDSGFDSASQTRVNTTVRIQLRYLDGSFENATFGVGDKLAAVRHHVIESGRIDTSFILSCKTSQPPRDFDDNDTDQRLDELGLAPSAVLLVKPYSGRDGANSGRLPDSSKKSKARTSKSELETAQRSNQTGVIDQTWALMRAMFSLFFIPFFAVWTLLNLYVIEPLRVRTANTLESASRSARTEPQHHSTDRPQTTDRSANARRNPGASDLRQVRDGRIRRLANMRPDDDPNATWNGNSTQQL